jgi:LEA14-like dessication related protein
MKHMLYTKGRLFMAALFLLMLSACSQFKPEMITPQVQVAGFELVEMGLFGGTAEVVLAIDNPNPIGFTANGLAYQVVLGGHTIADTRSDRKIAIDAAGKTLISIPFEFNYQGLISGIQSMLESRELSYDIQGKVMTDWISLPFQRSGKLDLDMQPGDGGSSSSGKIEI